MLWRLVQWTCPDDMVRKRSKYQHPQLEIAGQWQWKGAYDEQSAMIMQQMVDVNMRQSSVSGGVHQWEWRVSVRAYICMQGQPAWSLSAVELSTSWTGALHHIFHTLLHPISVFFSQYMPYHHNPFYCSIKIISSIPSLSTPYFELCLSP